MPAPDWRVEFFRRAFLRHAPRRYAVMLTLDEARRLGQKYRQRRGPITDTMITCHLAGALTLAVPAAVEGRAHLLPLDIDAGGSAAIQTLIAESARRALWAFGQYCPRHGLADADQRGYVWLPFDAMTDTDRLQALGAQLIAASSRPGWKVEARAIHAATRLPLARHTHTGRFGDLVLSDQIINIDQDPAGALAALRRVYQENESAGLPESPLLKPTRAQAGLRGQGLTIDRFNTEQDLIPLLIRYGARRAQGRGQLYLCPFHDDHHASLSVYTRRGQHYCCCFSAHSDCPLAQHRRNDAFNVYCIGEGIDVRNALRRLNKRR
jgi:hypothetical protein